MPLQRVLEEFGVHPENGNWKNFKCPFCQGGKKGRKSAAIVEHNGVQFFKCLRNSCPTGTKALPDVQFIAQMSNLSDREAFIAFLKMAHVWKERTTLKSATSSSPRTAASDGASSGSEAGSPVKPLSDAPAVGADDLVFENGSRIAVPKDVPAPVNFGTLVGDAPPPEVADAIADEESAQNSGGVALNVTEGTALRPVRTASCPQLGADTAPLQDPLLAQVIELANTEKISGRKIAKHFGIRLARGHELMKQFMAGNHPSDSRSDTGNQSSDSGNQSSDSGNQSSDSGNQSSDSGNHPSDSQSDSGNQSSDTGNHPSDSQSDSGNQSSDTGNQSGVPGEQSGGSKAEKSADGVVEEPAAVAVRTFYDQTSLNEEDLVKLWSKRGLLPATAVRLGFKSNPKTNEAVLLKLRERFPVGVLKDSGLWVRPKRATEAFPNEQFYGKGVSGKDTDGKVKFDWVYPVLIPYVREGKLEGLRPHKGGAPGGTVLGEPKLYVPDWQPGQKFSQVVITEGEFKAAALWQFVGGGWGEGEAGEAWGVAAVPGIWFATNYELRQQLEEWLRAVGSPRVVIAYDSEDKGNPELPGYKPNWQKRHDTLILARYLAVSLHQTLHLDTAVCDLPAVLRDAKGKADWDGIAARALAGELDSMLKTCLRFPETLDIRAGLTPGVRDVLRGVRELFLGLLREAVRPHELGELGRWDEGVEDFMAREVARKLYEPSLPHCGSREQGWIKRLKRLDRAGVAEAGFWARQWEALRGWYYKCSPLARSADKERYDYLVGVRDASHARREWEQKWFAQMRLNGMPGKIANFRIECLYLLRKVNGDTERMVRLVNELGERSRVVSLDAEAFHAPQKFRKWCLNRGNYNWCGNEKELEALQVDATNAMAYRSVQEVVSCGWFGLSGKRESGCLNGIWFFGDCAVANGQLIQPDEDGVYWVNEEGYWLSQTGREGAFGQGRPLLHPEVAVGEAGAEFVRPLFQEVSDRFCRALGGLDGRMVLGAMLGYVAAPEIYAKHNCFPGLWVHGLAGSGKTTLASWAMNLWGVNQPSGLDIRRLLTAVGMQIAAEQYSNLPVWFDEYRNGEVDDGKLAILRSSFNRGEQLKWTVDGIQRKIKTAFLVSGESSSHDAATRSRYPHVQAAIERRAEYLASRGLDAVEEVRWMEEHKDTFYQLTRWLLLHREEYVPLVLSVLDSWRICPELMAVSDRDRLVHGVAYAAWCAAAHLLEAYEVMAQAEFRQYMLGHVRSASDDVKVELNTNVFWKDVILAYQDGCIRDEDLRVEMELLEHPPGAPGQGRWESVDLYFNPDGVLSGVQEFLVKRRETLALKRTDLRDQLSKLPYWIQGKLRKRFGRASAGGIPCWGIRLDEHPLGYTKCSDEEFSEYWNDQAKGDPRKGPLYGIVEALQRKAFNKE